jgi:hypothetical protein
MLQKHQPDTAGARLERLGGAKGEPEAGHHVGDDPQLGAVDLAHRRFAVRPVGQRQHRIGMGMIDELGGQEGVKQRLDRRRRSIGAEEMDALLVDHLLVGQAGEGPQPAEPLKAHSGQPFGRDTVEVPARAFDKNRLDRLAQQVGHGRFDRGIAAAVQHQIGIAADQPGGVDAEGEVFAGRGVAFEKGAGRFVGPTGLHRLSSPPATPGDADSRRAPPPGCRVPAANRSGSGLPAAGTSGWIRSGRRTGARTGCRGRRSG